MSVDFTLDTADFSLALNQYAEACKKELPAVVNKVAADVAIRTGTGIEKAERTAIQRLADRKWWPRYVAMRAKQLGLAAGGKSNKRGRWAEAVKLSRNIIRSRLAHIGFLRAAWFRIADQILGRGKAGARSKPKLTMVSGHATRATADRLAVDMVAAYASLAGKSIEAVEPKVWPRLQEAMGAKAEDMRVYVRRKIAEVGDRHSARGT